RSWSSMALSIAISMVLPIHLYGLAHKISDSPQSLAPNQIPTFDNHDMHPLQAPLRTN
ncbi:hypothetical protein FHS91_003902, partial [Sphingobium xanthum]